MVELGAGAQQQAMGNGEIRDKPGKNARQLCQLLTHSLQRLGMGQGMLFLPWELWKDVHFHSHSMNTSLQSCSGGPIPAEDAKLSFEGWRV